MNEKDNYQELLKNPLWIGKRNEILSRDKNTCQMCGANDKYMHVHHKYYINGRKPWEHNNDCLITLCEDCHKYIHEAFVNELLGIKVGDIYGRYHSDWHNTGVVYAIDKYAGFIYVLSSDDGASFDNCYNEIIKLDEFKKWYHKEDNRDDWNYLFPCWFAYAINSKDVPTMFRMNILEILLSNDTLMQIITNAKDY